MQPSILVLISERRNLIKAFVKWYRRHVPHWKNRQQEKRDMRARNATCAPHNREAMDSSSDEEDPNYTFINPTDWLAFKAANHVV